MNSSREKETGINCNGKPTH